MTYSEIKIQEELDGLKMYKEAMHLYPDHWKEIGMDGGPTEWMPDVGRYLFLKSRGLLVVVSARYKDVVVGYTIMMLHKHPHHCDKLFATSDSIYVQKEYRKGMLGLKMLRITEKILKEKYKVDYVQLGIPSKVNMSPLLRRLNYKQTDIVYTKKIGD